MARKKNHIGLIYFVTIILTLVLVGGTAWTLYNKVLIPEEENSSSSVAASSDSGPLFYEASEDHCQTVLFVLEGGPLEHETAFAVIRYKPTENKLIYVPLSEKTLVQIGTEKSSLYEFYRKGGVNGAVDAAKQALNIPIDRYMKLDSESFITLCDLFGDVFVEVSEELKYSNPESNESTVIHKGGQTLTGNKLRRLLTYPNFEGGEIYKTELQGEVMTRMINDAAIKGVLSSITQSGFNMMVNCTETNFTAQDYDYRKQSIEEMASLKQNIAVVQGTNAVSDENGFLVIDSASKKSVADAFGVKPVVELAE